MIVTEKNTKLVNTFVLVKYKSDLIPEYFSRIIIFTFSTHEVINILSIFD